MLCAMTFFFLLLILSLGMAAASVHALLRDSRGYFQPPRSRIEDPRFRPPTAL